MPRVVRAAEAIRAVRTGVAPGQDAIGALQTARPQPKQGRERSRPWPRELRLSRLHDLLDQKPGGPMGRDESNGKRPLTSDARKHRAVVQAASSPAAAGATGCAQRQTTRALRLFWPDGQSSAAMGSAVSSATRVVAVAMPPLAACGLSLGGDASAARAVSARDTGASPLRVANPSFEEPDAAIPHVRIRGGPAERSAGLPDMPERRAELCLAPPLAPLDNRGAQPESTTRCRRTLLRALAKNLGESGNDVVPAGV